MLIDPELRQIDRYLASAARDGLRIRYLIDTHTHADDFSATRKLDVPVVMHTLSLAPFAHERVGGGAMRRNTGGSVPNEIRTVSTSMAVTRRWSIVAAAPASYSVTKPVA